MNTNSMFHIFVIEYKLYLIYNYITINNNIFIFTIYYYWILLYYFGKYTMVYIRKIDFFLLFGPIIKIFILFQLIKKKIAQSNIRQTFLIVSYINSVSVI